VVTLKQVLGTADGTGSPAGKERVLGPVGTLVLVPDG